jgi:hypothetical protein
MRAEKLSLQTDQQGVLQGLPVLAPNQKVEVILLIEDENQAVLHRKPSPRLANRGAILLGDDLAPAIPPGDWAMLGNNAQADTMISEYPGLRVMWKQAPQQKTP